MFQAQLRARCRCRPGLRSSSRHTRTEMPSSRDKNRTVMSIWTTCPPKGDLSGFQRSTLRSSSTRLSCRKGTIRCESSGAVQYPARMPRVTWVSVATASPMGQQRYEHEIQEAVRRIADPEWSFEAVTVASARANVPDAKRVSARLSNVAPLALSRAMGRALYGNPDLVHRLDLRLPAAWGREVITVHDLPPLRFPDEGVLTRSAVASARRASRIIAPSRFAADEIEALLGVDDVAVIPNGISSHYFESVAATDDELAALGVCAPFVMHAGGPLSARISADSLTRGEN